MNQSRKSKVLFICKSNSARSQMAEALLRMLYGDRYESYSAGLTATGVDPYAIKVMEQLGADMSSHRSKILDEFKEMDFDYVVTVCDQAKESCPYFPGRTVLHHNFPKPSTEGSEAEIVQ
ncbi:MAG: arsenate reductase ArsC, partial [Syntrophomonadaceae bacterium]|nr:arsenate reductase ArsC [Syntrophomonadaceae bacterium]